MNPEDVGKILDEIGERIGPAGEYAWTITVRQVVIEGVIWSSLLVLIVGFLIYALAFPIRRLLRSVHDEYPGKGWDLGQVLVAELGAMGAFALAGNSLPLLLNPEYHAMIRLLERIVP